MMRLEHEAPTAAHWTTARYQQLFALDSGGTERLVLLAEQMPKTGDSSRPPVLGFLVAHCVAPEWELENIVVALSARQKGLGKRLLEELVSRAKQRNSDAVFLEVRDSNRPARGLYEKAGFREAGRRKSYYSNPSEGAIVYRLGLR